MHGVIKEGTLYKYEKEKDRLRMGGGSWSINLDEIGQKGVEKVVYETDRATYTITAKDAKRHGFMRVMQGERKLIVPVKAWKVDEK